MHRVVPRSLLTWRLIAVLICYLDDSGKDQQNRITTLAGYVARDTGWAAFESEVEKWFTKFNVNILHAKQLHDTDGDFAGWPILKKQAFVARICRVLSRHAMLGASMSALKDQYEVRADESGRKRTVTPYSFCFEVINDRILRDVRTGSIANSDGIAYILEAGHENNPEVEQEFATMRKLHKIEHLLHSISFVPKESFRAIQMADLLAFYSRRDGVAHEKARREGTDSYSIDTMVKIIVEGLPHWGFVATDFGPESGSRFLGGPLECPLSFPPLARASLS
jgi:Protein of unknown function (DUF3800)